MDTGTGMLSEICLLNPQYWQCTRRSNLAGIERARVLWKGMPTCSTLTPEDKAILAKDLQGGDTGDDCESQQGHDRIASDMLQLPGCSMCGPCRYINKMGLPWGVDHGAV